MDYHGSIHVHCPLYAIDVRKWPSTFPFPPIPNSHSHKVNTTVVSKPTVSLIYHIYNTRHAIFNTLVIVICSVSNRHQLLSQPKMLASEFRVREIVDLLLLCKTSIDVRSEQQELACWRCSYK